MAKDVAHASTAAPVVEIRKIVEQRCNLVCLQDAWDKRESLLLDLLAPYLQFISPNCCKKRIFDNLCRPAGAQPFFFANPPLTRWANLWSRLRRLVLDCSGQITRSRSAGSRAITRSLHAPNLSKNLMIDSIPR